MVRKLTLMMAALTVTAFTAPALADAAPAITSSSGVLTPKGTKLNASSTNTVIQTSLGNLTCASTTLKVELTENTGTSVKAAGIGAGETTTCKLGGTKAITFTDITPNSLTFNVQGKGTMNGTWVADLPNGVVCHFTGAGLPFTYTAGSGSIKFNAADMTATPAACEPGLLNGDFTVVIAGSFEIIID